MNYNAFAISMNDVLLHSDWQNRFQVLQLKGFNYKSPRDLAYSFYHDNPTWKEVRKEIIKRDNGCDLGINGLYIEGDIIVHHIDPLVEEDFINWNVDKLFNPKNLICCSVKTHNWIHYGHKEEVLPERRPGDTKLW